MTVHFKVENHIAEITLDRQEVRNAIDLETIQELNQIFGEVKDNNDIWVAILTGAGDKAFSAGADLAKLPAQLAALGKPLRDVGSGILGGADILLKPLIAAVNGLALGGGTELALACDLRIAAENATFGLTEARWGIMPAGGGTQRLPRVIPLAWAMEILFTAKRIDAQEAYRIGLVNRVVPLAELMPTARQLAQDICENAPLSIRGIKEAVLRGLELRLSEGLLLESMILGRLQTSEDSREGIQAFLEKRKPEWKAR